MQREELGHVAKDKQVEVTAVFTSKGDWKDSFSFLKRCSKVDAAAVLKRYGEKGVAALAAATPVDTGLAASSWSYDIQKDASGATLNFNNSDIEGGYNVAILVIYGHGTRSGVYVRGRDFVTPALAPIIDELSSEIWGEVNGL